MERLVEDTVITIPVDQFIPLLEKVENGECLLLDVRNPDEFQNERIEGARNVPLESIKSRLKDLDRGMPLLLYCKVGKRCIKAVEQLREMGFHDIRVLDGGIENWRSRSRL